MNLKSIHLLLTYSCNLECDHCFLYCSPRSKGTFTIHQIKELLKEVKKIESIDSLGFEGGEPFLMYPLLLEAVRLANLQGLETAIQTNGYWSNGKEDAGLWLRPLHDAGLSYIDISADLFHHGEAISKSTEYAIAAATKIGLPIKTICIDQPEEPDTDNQNKGKPVYKGKAKLRGRAADKLTNGVATHPWETFTECPYEDLRSPGRVHLDSYGNVHLCQGLSMGNIWETPLSELLNTYNPDLHPVCGPILKGGPAELARTYNIQLEQESVDACHFCTGICKVLIDKFPQFITPRQVYGLT